jgi:hypothetical protein
VLVRLLRRFPSLAIADEARRTLDEHLTAANLATEAEHFVSNRGFERPYGWGWLLTLANELTLTPETATWSRNIASLVAVIRAGFLAWLPKATYPQRTGLHGNSAFGLLLALDHALLEERGGDATLLRAINAAALRWYADDAGYVARFEPSGSDFLSPALTEAALMARHFGGMRFGPWLDRFLPDWPDRILAPAIVSDPTDGQIAHLHGLNLSRAYCMRLIRDALPDDDPRRAMLESSMDMHATASLDAVVGSHYMVEHWLAAYALLLLS